MHDDDQVESNSERGQDTPPSRWRLIAGFLALTTIAAGGVAAWFVWQAPGGNPVVARDGELPLVSAPDTPDRVRPAPDARGGTVIANTDKQVFETFRKNQPVLEPGVERLLPPPETPLPEGGQVAEQPAAPETGYSNDNRDKLTDIVISKRDAVPVPETNTGNTARVAPAIVQKSSVPTPRQRPAAKPGKDEGKVAALKEPKKSDKQPPRRIKVDLSPERGDWRVQLAALRSHSDALATWKRLAARHPDLFADRAPMVTGTDLLKKGTYHRLRTGGFETRDEAAQFCQKVKTRKLECIVIRP